MAEAGDDGVATPDMSLEVFVAQGEEVGLDHLQGWIVLGIRWELRAGTHDGADANPSGQELRDGALSGTSRAADDENRGLV